MILDLGALCLHEYNWCLDRIYKLYAPAISPEPETSSGRNGDIDGNG